MAWSEFRPVPNAYDEEVQEIDERIFEAIAARRERTKNGRFYPSREKIAGWSARYGLEEAQIHWFLQHLQEKNVRRMPDELGALRGVVPIMKRTVADDCEYLLSHAMQHEHGSLVTLQIRYLAEDASEVQMLRANLMLEVTGGDAPYGVRRQGNRGGGPQTEMQFLIWPPLPEAPDGIAFSLLPSAVFAESKGREVTLERQVDFE